MLTTLPGWFAPLHSDGSCAQIAGIAGSGVGLSLVGAGCRAAGVFVARWRVPYKRRTLFGMMQMKTRRMELRTDAATDDLITEAAQLVHISKSAFVADAARLAAQRVIARSDTTLMASELFDSMMATLDSADDAPGLAEIAALPRLIAQ